MAEKNTLSILESIKKKIQKLDEPRAAENKDFSDLGDEFSYGASPNSAAKNNEAQNSKIEQPPEAFDDEIEREIGDSFNLAQKPAEQNAEDNLLTQENLDLNVDEKDQSEHDLTDEEDHDFSLDHLEDEDLEADKSQEFEDDGLTEDKDDDQEDFLEEDEEAQEDEEIENQNSEVEDVLPSKIDNKNSVNVENIDDDDDDDYFFENDDEYDDENDELKPDIIEDGESKNIVDAPQDVQPVVVKKQDLKSDEEELEDLLQQELALKTKDDKIAQNLELPKKPEQNLEILTKQESGQESEQKFNNVAEFLNHDKHEPLLNAQAAANVSDSIKKLVDAKNVVSGVTSFSKSEAFADIATHLMEPRLEKWLNENLPELVEKIVREEIKKIIPKE